MTFWVACWTIVLVVALSLFAGLAVVVGIGGWQDVRALLRTIGAQHDASADENT